MESVASLTRSEAEERAALIEVTRYDIAVDLRGLFEGEVLEATSTITFTCREPGASTFVDCVAEIRSATLNGVALDPSTAERGRLPLPDLRAENVLVVASSQSDTASAHGIQRTVDPSDKLVYLWTSFECDFARMAWANFDQPDLKAVHGFIVSAPADVDGAQQLGQHLGGGPGRGRAPLDVRGHPAVVDVRHGGQCGAVLRAAVASGRLRPRACTAGSR